MALAVRISEGNGLTWEYCTPNNHSHYSAALDFSWRTATAGVQIKQQTMCLGVNGYLGYAPF